MRQNFEAANIIAAFNDLHPDAIARSQTVDPIE
jgi:hypothetical protein